MKRIRIVDASGKTLNLNGQAPAAIGVLQILAGASRRVGFTVRELSDRLTDAGILMKNPNDEQALSCLLQRLIHLGLVQHPRGTGGSQRYVLRRLPSKILIA